VYKLALTCPNDTKNISSLDKSILGKDRFVLTSLYAWNAIRRPPLSAMFSYNVEVALICKVNKLHDLYVVTIITVMPCSL